MVPGGPPCGRLDATRRFRQRVRARCIHHQSGPDRHVNEESESGLLCMIMQDASFVCVPKLSGGRRREPTTQR